MNVVYVANDAYAQHLAVSMCSLLDACQDEERLNVAVVSMGITEESRRKIRKTAESFGREVLFRELPEERLLSGFSGLLDTGRFDVSTMGRLFLDELLPESWDRVLYLDCDTVVLKPLSRMYRRGLSGDAGLSRVNRDRRGLAGDAGRPREYQAPRDGTPGNAPAVMAAVQEPTIYPEVRAYLGLRPEDPYFNAGVLLIDLKAFRREQLFPAVRRFYGTAAEQCLFNDQDALNGCLELKGRIAGLPPVFNFFTNYRYFRYDTLAGLSPSYSQVSRRQFAAAKRRPAVIHYAGAERPWVAGALNYYGRAYRLYLAMTPFAGAKKQEGKRISMLCYHAMELLTVVSPALRQKISAAYIQREIRVRERKLQGRAAGRPGGNAEPGVEGRLR